MIRTIAATSVLLVWTAVVHAQTVPFDSLQLNGSAELVATPDGTVLRVVDSLPFDAGSAFTMARRSITAFSTTFQFRITESTGADGLAFVVQPVSPDALGLYGGGLGYAGITPSVGVEFDFWFNPPGPDSGFVFADPDDNHVGVNVNGEPISVVTAPAPGDIDNGMVWTVWIDYRGTTLDVRMSATGVRPEAPLLSYPIDIPAVLGTSQAFLGFSAGTGVFWANHDVLSWSLEQELSIRTLIETVVNAAIPAGLKRSLLAKLSAAQAADARGNAKATCGALRAFRNQLESEAARRLYPDPAIRSDAVAVVVGLGCEVR